MRILHTADLHLGQVLYQYYNRVDEHEYFFQQLNQWCSEYNPDALLVSGDIFDIQQPGAASKAFFNNSIACLHRSFPSMAIVVTAGNHDSGSRIEADSSLWALADIKLIGHGPSSDALDHPGWEDRFIVQTDKGFIAALPFMPSLRKDIFQSVIDRVQDRNIHDLPVVLMAHTAVSGGDFSGHSDIGNIKSFSLEELGTGYDYLALGHIHRSQTLGHDIDFEFSDSTLSYPAPVARYSGSPHHVSCDEQYPHSVSLVDIDKHQGSVSIKKLFIEQRRHFFIIPNEKMPAAKSADEIYSSVSEFCKKQKTGYIRLRIDASTPLPPDFTQNIYNILETTGNEVRYNPKIIFENIAEHIDSSPAPTFEIAELQQMTNPLNFIEKTIAQYPDLSFEEIKKDFEEVERKLHNMSEKDNKNSKLKVEN
ncbi:MAG: exonuclease subunit SbcD [Bacteroidales bacterium]|nr:exonuclease subunit SbcD [Bacteroidales bacterium]